LKDAAVMPIDYLADHPELAALLASWHVGEWADLLPGWTLAEAEAELRAHGGRRCIPTTFVALGEGRPVGSASLLVSDLEGWERLSPWLASVYVVPERRGRGVGGRLVRRVVEEAQTLGQPNLYLWTAGQRAYYERLGWVVLEQAKCH